jgi:hypothetical protein
MWLESISAWESSSRRILMSKHKFGLGDRVLFGKTYHKIGFIDLETDDRAVYHEESDRTSIPKYVESILPKERSGIVFGIRKITLFAWLRFDGDEHYEHYTSTKQLEAQVYRVATDMSHTHLVNESWMKKFCEVIK